MRISTLTDPCFPSVDLLHRIHAKLTPGLAMYYVLYEPPVCLE